MDGFQTFGTPTEKGNSMTPKGNVAGEMVRVGVTSKYWHSVIAGPVYGGEPIKWDRNK